ncbi:NIN like protein 7 [Actinidia rufa]|uniref:NIN like protein 7 n=1 Tax=Actinidia rufa TaxID=165716 RepID=A0A7J0DLW2_9ERIC|nr:NIN like protein 7 [Actinidia rufa]
MAEPEKYWNLDDFKEYVRKELNRSRIDCRYGITRDAYPISDDDWNDNWILYGWIFWSKKHDDSDPLLPTIQHVLQKLLLLSFYGMEEMLVQFWAATKTSDGRTLLTTKDQPFGLDRLSHGLCEYRMISKDYKFYVDGEEDLGIPGRVFRNKCPEYTPNAEYYSVKEYPQRDHALRCGVRQSLTLPVIKHSSQICVGVLEIVGEFLFRDTFDSLFNRGNPTQKGLHVSGNDGAREKSWTRDDFMEHVHKELNWSRIDYLDGIRRDAYPISDDDWNGNWNSYDWIFWSKKTRRFRSSSPMISEDYTFYGDGEEDLGIPGRVYRNKYRECTPDVEYYFVKEHPQRDCALRCGVGQSLTLPVIEHSSQICVGVIEIVCPKCDLIGGFRFSSTWERRLYAAFQIKGLFRNKLAEQVYTGNDDYVLEIFLSDSNKDEDPLSSLSKILETMKKEFKTFSLASGEVLVKELSVHIIEFQNVSISTFKRVCRKYGIKRWPPRNVGKVRPPPSHVDHQEEVPQLNSNLPSNQASASIAHTQPHDTVMQNANTVNVKVKYGNDITIKFQLSLSSGLVELQQQVAKRLNLEAGSYHIKYKDEEDELILIACDEDLQDCLRTCRSPGSNAVVLHIDPISQVSVK